MEPLIVNTELMNSAVAKFGAEKCKKACELFAKLQSMGSVAQEMGCPARDVVDMVLAGMSMRTTELNASLAGFSYDRDRLPDCQVDGCPGKVSLVRARDDDFFCDTCFARHRPAPND